MTAWYPMINVTNTLAGAFGSLNSTISGSVMMNGDWFWTMIAIAIFAVIYLVFTRNGNDILESLFVSSLIMLVLSSILFSIGIIFIMMPLVFFMMVLITMSISIANRPSY